VDSLMGNKHHQKQQKRSHKSQEHRLLISGLLLLKWIFSHAPQKSNEMKTKY
jgi:hypothetical protein